MSNMAYCRFENTRGALSECLESLVDGNIATLSAPELISAKAMFAEFLQFIEDEIGCIELNEVQADVDRYLGQFA